ncbi:MAG: hypothetical protein GC168_16640 [Candidatus Hydrogenedens sp.]|nr:hypothetical protein [Candidatus Hydrogenedens sp.]
MAGGAKAVASGQTLEDRVVVIATELGLKVETQVKVGRRIWGAVRKIDVVLKDPTTRVSLGIECKFQKSSGTAEEKIHATIRDMEAWPIRGIVVYSGPGFSENMKAFLLSTGKAVDLDDLNTWLRLYFGL